MADENEEQPKDNEGDNVNVNADEADKESEDNNSGEDDSSDDEANKGKTDNKTGDKKRDLWEKESPFERSARRKEVEKGSQSILYFVFKPSVPWFKAI